MIKLIKVVFIGIVFLLMLTLAITQDRSPASQTVHYIIPGDCVLHLECPNQECRKDVKILLRRPVEQCMQIEIRHQ